MEEGESSGGFCISMDVEHTVFAFIFCMVICFSLVCNMLAHVMSRCFLFVSMSCHAAVM